MRRARESQSPALLGLTRLTRWFLLSGLVGAIAGLGAVAFFLLSHALAELCMGFLVGYEPLSPANEPHVPLGLHVDHGLIPWLLLVVPTVGGLLSGWIVFQFAPEAEGHGTDSVIEAYHRNRGRIRIRVPLVKMIASSITLGTGGSAGREGPIAQIGAGFGSWLGEVLKLSVKERRILLAAGMGAGVGAIFKAPLAGALFATEVLYRDTDMEGEVLLPAALSSILAFAIYASFPFVGYKPLFGLPGLESSDATFAMDWQFDNAYELIPYFVLAIVVSAGAWLWVRSFYGIAGLFQRLPIPRMLKPGLGGLITGAIGLGLYLSVGAWLGDDGLQEHLLAVIGFGYSILQGGLSTQEFAPAWIVVFLLVAAGKVVTTSCSIGSGGSGGVFGPSMVIGGSLGGAVGVLAQMVATNLGVPELVPNPAAFIIVGMAGFFSGAARTPVSTVVMVSEMTGSYGLLAPSMFVCTLSAILVRGPSLYRNQPSKRTDSPAHRGDFIVDLLENTTVRDAYRRNPRPAQTIPESMTLNRLIPLITGTNQPYFPVVDAEGRITGIFSLNDIREVLYDRETLGDLVAAKDFATSMVVVLREGESLNEALAKFTVRNIDELPVLEDAPGEASTADKPAETSPQGRFIGMLSRREVLAMYTEKLAAWKEDVAHETVADTRIRGRAGRRESGRAGRVP